MFITERDLMLLRDLFFIKYINSKRVAKLFGNYKSAMRRLKQLSKNNYIRIADHLLNGERVFCLSTKGFAIISKNPYRIKKTDKINHCLACADFYFYLKGGGHDINYFALEESLGRKHKFRPDIILQTDKWYLVEIDLSNKRFEEKVIRWEGYYISMEFLRRFSIFPPVIIVSNNTNKIKKIINRVKKINLNYIYIEYNKLHWDKYEK